jgi:hypothetical protein
MAVWSYRCYINVTGSDLIDEWYREQDGEVRGNVDAVLEHLGNRQRDAWRRPQFDMLSGVCKGIAEIQVKARSGQYRLLGCFGPERLVFTLLICFKKTRASDTEHACRTAQNRRKEVDLDVSRAGGCRFP